MFNPLDSDESSKSRGLNIWTKVNLFTIANKLSSNLDVDCSFTINGILVKIWLSEIDNWERFHITTTISTAQSFLNISTFLLESGISSNWTVTGFSSILSDLVDKNGLDWVHALLDSESETSASNDSQHAEGDATEAKAAADRAAA